MLMLATLTEGKNQIKDEVSLTLLGALRESIELSKGNQKGRDVFVRFFNPFPHTYCSLFLWVILSLAGFPVVHLLQQKSNVNKAPQLFAG